MGTVATAAAAPTMQATYVAGTDPHVLNDVGDPLTFQGRAGESILELKDSAGVVQHSWQETTLTLGPAVTAILSDTLTQVDIASSLFPTRAVISFGLDKLQFLRQDRSFATSPSLLGGFFSWGSTLTSTSAGSSFGGFITLGGTFQFSASAGAFGMGNALLHSATWKNTSGIAANLGPSFLFANNATYQADGATITANQARIYFDNSTYDTINAGAISMGAAIGHVSFYSNLTVSTGATIALRRGMLFQDATVTGTLTEQQVIYIPNLAAATTNYGIFSEHNGTALIRHEGTASSQFGGAIELGSGATFDWQLSRLAPDIATLGTGDSLRVSTGNLFFGSSGTVALSSSVANRLDLSTGDSFRIVAGDLEFGADVALTRGAADRLDLASGDSLRVVSGAIQFAGSTEAIGQVAGVLQLNALTRVDMLAPTLRITSGTIQFGTEETFAVSSGTLIARASAGVLVLGSEGDTDATPLDTVWRITNGSGIDINGADLFIQPGLGTGAGDPGDIHFRTGTVLGSGSTLQTPTTRITINDIALFATVGTQIAANMTDGIPGFTFSADLDTGIGHDGLGDIMLIYAGGVERHAISGSVFTCASNQGIAWSSSTTETVTTLDTFLQRSGAGVLDLNSSLSGGGNGTLRATAITDNIGTLTFSGATGVSAPGAGTNSEAWGASAVAAGLRGTSLGFQASASAQEAVAIGDGALGGGAGAIAIGDAASATNTNGPIAIGDGAVCSSSAGLAIGFAATASTSSNAHAIGNSVTCTGLDSWVLGRSVTVSGTSSIGFGRGVTGNQTISIGISGAASAGADQVIIGYNAVPHSVGNSGNVLLGSGTSAGVSNTDSIAIGRAMATTAADQVLIRGSTLVLGSLGDTSATPTNTLWRITNAAGTDINGADLTIRTGLGTGAGDPGAIFFQVGSTLGTGSTLQTPTTRLTVDEALVNVTNADLQVEGLPVPIVLGSATGIDLTSTGETTIYTVPSGRSAVILDVILVATAATAANGDASAGVGMNAGADDLFSPVTIAINAADDMYQFIRAAFISGATVIATSGQTVDLGVDSADTGTALTVTAYAIGYLV